MSGVDPDADRIRPAACDKLAVPTQNRCRRHEQRPLPSPLWQHLPERRQQRPISLRQLRTSDLTLQHLQLMAEQENLDLLLPLRTTPKHEQLKEPPKRPVEERKRDALRPARHDRQTLPTTRRSRTQLHGTTAPNFRHPHGTVARNQPAESAAV
jgi:hypothetical protein